MRVKRSGGMMEFIPSPSEKRDGVIRDNVLGLLANLDARMRRLEYEAGVAPDLAAKFSKTLGEIMREESQVHQLNQELLDVRSIRNK